MSKKIIFISFALILSSSFCFAAETVTITTYYPAPYGIYNVLRLNPNDSFTPAAACVNRGEMYYDDSDSRVYICNGTWQGLSGGSYWLYTDPGSPANIAYVYIDETLHNPNNVHLGIGNSAPPFTLSLGDVASARDGGIFAAGITGDGGGFSSDTWPATLANGAYLIWHPESAAFRVGTANNNRWNSGNVGGYSVAIGSDTMASGGWSLALGTSTTASGSRSTAMGYNTTASGDDSISMGRTVQATASSAVVIGLGADSSNPIVNNVANSFMVGFNSNIPTFYVGTSSGVGTTGNVGIGISAPAAKLHVSGEARITGISGDGTGKAVCIKADGNLGTCTTAVGATGLCTCN